MLNDILNFWTEADTLEKVAKAAPYVFIALGFLVALSGQYVRSSLDSRIKGLRAEREAARKGTSPQINVQLVRDPQSDQALVAVTALNDIPFKARWLIVTEQDEVVGGVMLQDVEFHPAAGRNTWSYQAGIDMARIRNGLLELRFEWWSVYSAELNNPEALRGRTVHRYRLVGSTIEPMP